LASFGIGAKLRRERLGKGLVIDDISRDTKIAPRFLEAIETDDYSSLPALIFTRNFVRQYALILKLDPDPLLAELPKANELTAPLPTPPRHPRSTYHRDRRRRLIGRSGAWLLLAGVVGVAAYAYLKHFTHTVAQVDASAKRTPAHTSFSAPFSSAPPTPPATAPPPEASAAAARVQVSLTAHQPAWVQVSADGKITFIGTLQPNETKEVSAAEQVKVLTGNAGALTISLNGKTLESLGPLGQVRAVRLTAEGPQFPPQSPPPAPGPL
jgi:cytoskeleton protein RodZ